MMWEMQLKRLQMESSVRVIAYELNLAQTTPSVRICARKNGETSDGVIVIGNSINQVSFFVIKLLCFVAVFCSIYLIV